MFNFKPLKFEGQFVTTTVQTLIVKRSIKKISFTILVTLHVLFTIFSRLKKNHFWKYHPQCGYFFEGPPNIPLAFDLIWLFSL